MFGGAPQGNGQNEDGFYELQATDNVGPDLLVNTATVTCTVAGFPSHCSGSGPINNQGDETTLVALIAFCFCCASSPPPEMRSCALER